MKMRDRFAGVRAVVDDEAVAGGFQAELVGDFSGLKQQMTEEMFVGGRGVGNAHDGVFWGR